jgi:hypothetical protein
MTTTTRKASEIKFGIEIEASIPNEYREMFQTGRYHGGLAVNHEHFGNDWTVQSDSSVRSGRGYFAAEIVSNPLQGEAGLIKVVEMLDFLKSIGAKVNASCGLHVYVDSAGVSLTRLVKLFKSYEMAFYDMNGKNSNKRLNSRFCKPSSRWTGDRYASLNLAHAHDVNPHIEIRVWQGAMKPETVVAAIYMAVALVARASMEEKVKVSDVNASKPTQIMAQFIRRMMDENTMIVPDLKPADIWQEMMKAALSSDRR